MAVSKGFDVDDVLFARLMPSFFGGRPVLVQHKCIWHVTQLRRSAMAVFVDVKTRADQFVCFEHTGVRVFVDHRAG